MKNDFDTLTDAQRKRDEAVIQNIRKKHVEPLLHLLNRAIPGYMELSEYERFLAIMKLNERHAPIGEYLLLDFGVAPDATGDTCYFPHGAVFSGKEWNTGLVWDSNPNAPTIYRPEFYDSSIGSIEDEFGQSLTLFGVIDDEDENEDEDEEDNNGIVSIPHYGEHVIWNEQYPLPYRIALIAKLIRRSILCTHAEACRFAAGWDEELHPSRTIIEPMETGGDGSMTFGWNIAIRDTTPTQAMMEDLRVRLHSAVDQDRKRKEWARQSGWLFSSFSRSSFTEQEPEIKNRRDTHQSTKCLTDFLFRFLPERGLHVGRKGKGEKLGWDDAYQLFTAEYGDYYTSVDSFQKRCYAHLKARKEG